MKYNEYIRNNSAFDAWYRLEGCHNCEPMHIKKRRVFKALKSRMSVLIHRCRKPRKLKSAAFIGLKKPGATI